jgi:pimeloyl-ACP methyl ester carboxylesterase
MPLANARGVAIHYRHQPNPAPAGPAVVFVHGYCCASSDWAGPYAGLAEQWTVVAPDLIGHGESSSDEHTWTIERCAQAVSAVLDAIGAESVVLIGHSMGCRIALQTYLNSPHRVAALVLVDGSWTGSGNRMTATASARQRIQAMGERAWIIDSFERMLLPDVNPELAGELRARALTAPVRAASELLPDMFGWDAECMTPALDRLEVPTLAIQSTDLNEQLLRVGLRAGDRTRWLRLLEAHVRDLRVEIVPAHSHFAMLERPAELTNVISAFLRDRISR